MNKGNERLLAFIAWMRSKPRWVLVLITVGVVVILGVAMFLLIPQNQNPNENSTYLTSTGLAFNVFLKLGVIVLLLIGLAIVLRRWQSKDRITNTKQITLLETLHLSPHRTLYLVEIQGHKILIGGTDQSMNNLYQLETLANDQLSAIPESFSDILEKSTNSFSQNKEVKS